MYTRQPATTPKLRLRTFHYITYALPHNNTCPRSRYTAEVCWECKHLNCTPICVCEPPPRLRYGFESDKNILNFLWEADNRNELIVMMYNIALDSSAVVYMYVYVYKGRKRVEQWTEFLQMTRLLKLFINFRPCCTL